MRLFGRNTQRLFGDEIDVSRRSAAEIATHVVNVTANVGMMGATYISSAPGRPSVEVHPYPWTAAGATVVPALRDENGLLHIAVVHNQRRDAGKKVLRLSEGYMHPKGCAETRGSQRTKAPNDEAEIQIAFHGVDHRAAYGAHPALPVQEPDRSLVDVAIRELREETSLEVQPAQLTQLGLNESDGKIHCVAAYFLADLNATGQVFAEPPQLQSPDPAEIDEIYWMQPKDITRVEHKFFFGDFEILAPYSQMMGHAVIEMRRQELSKVAGKKMTSPEDLYDLINPFLNDFRLQDVIAADVTKNHDEALGDVAEQRHQQFLIVAELYNQRIRDKKAREIAPIERSELESLISAALEANSQPGKHQSASSSLRR